MRASGTVETMMILRTRVGVARASSSVRTGMDGRAVVPARRRSSAMTPTRTTRTTARGGRETRSGREVRAFATPDFEEMASGRSRKYYMVGGKGGVGKTSLSSSLAVKFAAEGHHTLVVSTDPAHSLSDSLAQNVRGGMPVEVSDMNGMLYALEIDPESAKEEFTQFARKTDMGSGAKDFMSSVGLGAFADSIADLKLGELLDTPPPGLDEAIAIAKVLQFTKDEKFSKFTRIVFDTAPTGHTLRLLSLPDFLDASIGKIVRLRQKLTSATDAVKGIFGVGEDKEDDAVEKLEQLKAQVKEVRTLFRNKDTTEFIIVTIPTVLGVSESGRLLQSLREEDVPCKRLVVNQVLKVNVDDYKSAAAEARDAQDALEGQLSGADAEAMEKFTELNAKALKAAQAAVNFCSIKEKDQARALQMCQDDAGLKTLNRTEAPLFDMEIRGVPALKFFGDQVWR
jgi:arsenite-transporting ATPase|tara:strand:+ start:2401 stop:3765 length:1365 start_codon:yes stop_codon:yes gene_type:complete